MEFAGCAVAGEQELGRSEGYNRYAFPDGTHYYGLMSNGLFHTVAESGTRIGTVYFPASLGSGRVKAIWEKGVPTQRNFFSEDGLAYVEGKWNYCVDEDRRLWHERRTFILPPTLYGIRDPNTIIPDLTPIEGGEEGDLETAPDDARKVFLSAVSAGQLSFDPSHLPDMSERTIPSLVAHDTTKPALEATIPPDLREDAARFASNAPDPSGRAAHVRAAVAEGVLPSLTSDIAAAAALAPPPGLAAWCTARALEAGIPERDVPDVVACVRRNPLPLTAALIASPTDAPEAVRNAAVAVGLPESVADLLAAATAAGNYPGKEVARSTRVGVMPVAAVDVYEGVVGAAGVPGASGGAVSLPRRAIRPNSASSAISGVTVAALLQSVQSPSAGGGAGSGGRSAAIEAARRASGASSYVTGVESAVGGSSVITQGTAAARSPLVGRGVR